MPRPTLPMIDTLESRVLFTAPHIFGVSLPLLPQVGGQAQVVAKGDFNNDGMLDLAIVGGKYDPKPFVGGLQIVLNRGGTNHFEAVGQLQSLVQTGAVAAADFNQDGNLDVAVGDQDTVIIFLGNGDGTLTRAGQFLSNWGSESMTTGDFNGDGRMDIAASGERLVSYDPAHNQITTESQIAVLLNNGNNLFSTVFTHIAGNSNLRAVVIDYDRNGRADLAVRTPSGVQILTSKGDGTFNFPTRLATGPVAALTSADLNRDGRLDIVYATANPTSEGFALALANGGFGPLVTLPSPPNAIYLDIGVGDFNGDGRLDILADIPAASGVFFQQTNGKFVFAPDGSGSNFANPIVGDFNNDKGDDVVDGASEIYYSIPLTAAELSPVYLSPKRTLVITGNRRADSLNITLNNGNLVIVLNHVTYTYPLASVRRFQIATGLSADLITIDPGITLNALISAGGSSDTVHSGGGNDTLQGDNQDDLLDGGAGDDLIQAGKGNDTLMGGPGFDTLFGSHGTDTYSIADQQDELLDRTPDELLI